jgi:hypothetical protein
MKVVLKMDLFVISNNVEIPQVLSNDAGLIRREKVDFDLVLGGK